MATQSYGTSTLTTVADTELNSLGNGIRVLSKAVTGNTAEFADFELVLPSLAVVDPATVNIYVNPQIDGTNYVDGNTIADVPGTQWFLATIEIKTGTNAKRDGVWRVPLPPGNFKFIIENKTGVAFASTLNTLKMRTTPLIVV